MGGVFIWHDIQDEGFEDVKRNSSVNCCRRRLDGGEPYIFAARQKCNKSLLRIHIPPSGWSLFAPLRRPPKRVAF
jgi:hypothetical protein